MVPPSEAVSCHKHVSAHHKAEGSCAKYVRRRRGTRVSRRECLDRVVRWKGRKVNCGEEAIDLWCGFVYREGLGLANGSRSRLIFERYVMQLKAGGLLEGWSCRSAEQIVQNT